MICKSCKKYIRNWCQTQCATLRKYIKQSLWQCIRRNPTAMRKAMNHNDTRKQKREAQCHRASLRFRVGDTLPRRHARPKGYGTQSQHRNGHQRDHGRSRASRSAPTNNEAARAAAMRAKRRQHAVTTIRRRQPGLQQLVRAERRRRTTSLRQPRLRQCWPNGAGML